MPLSIATGLGIDLTYLTPGYSYMNKILGYSPVAYWPMNESEGSVALNAVGDPDLNGTYTAVSLANNAGPDGQLAPLFDGVTSFLDVFSAELNTVLQGWDTGTIAGWIRVENAGVWTDATTHRFFIMLADANNYSILQTGGDGNMDVLRRCGSITAMNLSESLGNSTDWIHVAFTWNQSADVSSVLADGLPLGAEGDGGGPWVGDIEADRAVIGASNHAPDLPWDGWLAHWAVWDVTRTPAQILDMATV